MDSYAYSHLDVPPCVRIVVASDGLFNPGLPS